jgi:hypothetical protein
MARPSGFRGHWCARHGSNVQPPDSKSGEEFPGDHWIRQTKQLCILAVSVWCPQLNKNGGPIMSAKKNASGEKKTRAVTTEHSPQQSGRLKRLGGSASDDWNHELANQTLRTLWLDDADSIDRKSARSDIWADWNLSDLRHASGSTQSPSRQGSTEGHGRACAYTRRRSGGGGYR